MVNLSRAKPKNISFTSKRNIHSYILTKRISDRKVLFNHSFDLSACKLFSVHSILNFQSFEFCLNILEGIKCITRYTVQKKSPINVKNLYKLYSHLLIYEQR